MAGATMSAAAEGYESGSTSVRNALAQEPIAVYKLPNEWGEGAAPPAVSPFRQESWLQGLGPQFGRHLATSRSQHNEQ